jgi:hypothetical protein
MALALKVLIWYWRVKMKPDYCKCWESTDLKQRMSAWINVSAKIRMLQNALFDDVSIDCVNQLLEYIDNEIEYLETRVHELAVCSSDCSK